MVTDTYGLNSAGRIALVVFILKNLDGKYDLT